MKKIFTVIIFTSIMSFISFGQNSIEFDGSGDYVNCGTIAGLANSTQLTIELWINSDALGGYTHFMDLIGGSLAVQQDNAANTIQFVSYLSGQRIALGTMTGITTGTWHHIAAVFDGTQTGDDKVKIYYDGSPLALTYSGTGMFTAALSGSVDVILSRSSLTVDGRMDEVRIWNIALDASAISSIYSQTFSNPTSPSSCLMAYYQMTNGSGTTVTNNANPGTNDGTFVNNTSWSGSEPTLNSVSAPTCSSLLPVELIDFTAKEIENQVNLSWSTASELDNEGFDLQRSPDAKSWETLDFISGFGTSLDAHSYTYKDKSPLKGQSYYRLKQMDYDGAFEYSKVVSVEVGGERNAMLFFPNPGSEGGSVNLRIDSENFESGELTLFDMTGKAVLVQKISSANMDLDLSYLSKGIYAARLTFGGEQLVEKLLIE